MSRPGDDIDVELAYGRGYVTHRGERDMYTPAHLVTTAVRWPVESQQRARRNAMIASNALARRRVELDEVEEFLATVVERLGQEATGRPANR
jgi:hypothetical protein